MSLTPLRSLAAIASLALASQAMAATINEVRIDDVGTDNHEYFELAGTPGESLDGLFYVVIGDGSSSQGSGVLERVIDLDGLVIPADGFFLAANSGVGTANGDITVPSTPVIDLTFGSNTFENSDNVTHLLVSGLTASAGDDLDDGDTGVLDTPWTSVIDGFSLLETDPLVEGELLYASQFGLPTIGPDGSFVPGHVFRLPNETGPFSIGPFGTFTGPTFDTPGVANFVVPEPASFVLIALGLVSAGAVRMRRVLG
ncbi:MAG: PEP-CTERM sorting domain-containing protein [Planctomycetota bacterium]